MNFSRALKLSIGWLLGYRVPVRVIRVRGKTNKALKEYGRLRKMKNQTTRQFELWIERRKLPIPPSDAYIGEEVQVASSEKGKYRYVKFNVDSSKIEGIDQDMRFWAETEVMFEQNRIEDKSGWLEKHGTTIMVGIIGIICVIMLIAFVKVGLMPLIERASSIGAVACNCNVTGLPFTNALTNATGLVPPI